MSAITRAFLALTLPKAMIELAGDTQAELRSQHGDRDIRWVRPTNFHITLRFFGDLARPELDRAGDLVKSLDGKIAAVSSGWSCVGAFPSMGRPQVIWLGLRDPAGSLELLAESINGALVSRGFGPADKPFKAHVTLGRVRRGHRVSLTGGSNRLTISGETFNIGTITLMKSLLTPQGPVYTPIETAQLSV